MAPKKETAPFSRYHPSQSSTDVSKAVKDQVKASQDNKCWLCDCRAHKKRRPLELCHVYPQAISSRRRFILHHKAGRISVINIHDPRNLVALCQLCHFAYDNNEWIFMPEGIQEWLANVKESSNAISTYRSQKNILYRRHLLDLDAIVSNTNIDEAFRDAFTERPTKTWHGEASLTILRATDPPADPEPELEKAFDSLLELAKIWGKYRGECPLTVCSLCGKDEDPDDDKEDDDEDEKESEDDKEGKDDKEHDDENDDEDDEEDDEDSDEEDDEQSDDDDENEEDTEDKNVEDDEDENEKNDEEDEEDSRRKKRSNDRASPKPRKKQRKSSKNNWRKQTERDWMTSRPYDKRIPFSHRYGYTYANCTSNDHIERWISSRGVSDDC